jgi:hypothetical protein
MSLEDETDNLAEKAIDKIIADLDFKIIKKKEYILIKIDEKWIGILFINM